MSKQQRHRKIYHHRVALNSLSVFLESNTNRIENWN